MKFFVIIELEDGFTVAGVPQDSTPEEVAKGAGGVLIDEGPYASAAQAQEVLLTLPNPYEADKPWSSKTYDL